MQFFFKTIFTPKHSVHPLLISLYTVKTLLNVQVLKKKKYPPKCNRGKKVKILKKKWGKCKSITIYNFLMISWLRIVL